MSSLYEFFYGMSIVTSILVTCLAAAADIWALREIFHDKDDGVTSKKIALVGIVIVSILIIIASWSRGLLTKVPDILGKPYENAQHILDEANLNYDVFPQNNLKVLDQYPMAGKIVPKGTEVALTLGDARSDPEWIERFEKSINAEYGTLAVRLKSTEAELRDGANVIACFGPIIDADIVRDAYLLQEDYAVKYINYTISDGMLVFERVPIGITFDLTISADGYEDVTVDIRLSSENMTDKVFTLTLGIIPKNVELGLATTFRVADSNRKFMSGVKIDIKFGFDEMLHGRYKTNDDGSFEYAIWIMEDQTLDVCLIDPFGNGVDSCGQVWLHKFEPGDSPGGDVIIVSEDNTCYTVKESGFFGL